MAAISALLLAIASDETSTLVHLPGYIETLEFAASYAGLRTVSLEQDSRNWAQGDRIILWLDVPSFGQSTAGLYRCVQAADLVVFDTTAFSAQSGRIPRFLRWARRARTPVILVQPHKARQPGNRIRSARFGDVSGLS